MASLVTAPDRSKPPTDRVSELPAPGGVGSILRPALSLLGLFTLLTGLVYPLAITGVSSVLFSRAAGGSLITRDDGRVIGSELIGQPFDDPKYFWGRPSATAPHAYNASASTGSNAGPSNPALREAVAGRVAALAAAHPGASGARSVAERHGDGSAEFTSAGYPGASGARSVAERRGVGSAEFTSAGDPGEGAAPVDLVTTSASGLDPHISPRAAEYQIRRVAEARGLSPERVRALVDAHVEGRTLALLGEPRVNVLALNLALDALAAGP